MKIAVMQPFFLPWLAYFSLIKHTDRFILLDPVQFTNAWVNRNRILKPELGWQYIVIPLVKHRRDIRINDVCIYHSTDWRERILCQLVHYKKRAPFYDNSVEVLKQALAIETDSIVQLNRRVLQTVCDYIGIKFNVDIYSQMEPPVKKALASDEWGLNMCKALGDVDEFWEPEGGRKIYSRSKYDEAGVTIKFLKFNFPIYSQGRPEFEAGLSIIDLMMFNSPQRINQMLDDYELL